MIAVRCRLRRVVIAALHVLAVAAAMGPRAGTAAPGGDPSIFGTTEVRSTQLQSLPKWTGVLDRYADERNVPDGPCNASFFTRCHMQAWKALLHDLDGKDRKTQLETINSYMNEVSYLTDPINYGVPDYWATPRQFLTRRGDCEDYAIAKFMSLRALGFDSDTMRIVVLNDLNLRIAHAILVVYIEGRALVLDNQIRTVVAASSIRHYRPIYSVNESTLWIHRAP
jgi:predicted transglutaminase-like cysteine proteinase